MHHRKNTAYIFNIRLVENLPVLLVHEASSTSYMPFSGLKAKTLPCGLSTNMNPVQDPTSCHTCSQVSNLAHWRQLSLAITPN